jgi:putative aldouronate transport system substrate-binding protein
MGDGSPCYVSDELSNKIADPINDIQVADKDRLAPYYAKEYFPLASIKPEEANEIAMLRTDIHNYAKQLVATWVVNGGVEKEYAGFITQLENMGLRRLEAIYQGIYDRYIGK